MKTHELFTAWILLCVVTGSRMAFGEFSQVYESKGDFGVRDLIAFREFDPSI